MTDILLLLNAMLPDELAQIKQSLCLLTTKGLRPKLSLLYINPSVPSEYLMLPSASSYKDVAENRAKSTLKRMGDYFNVDVDNHWIAHGATPKQTMRLADKLASDKIIISRLIMPELSKHNKRGYILTSAEQLGQAYFPHLAESA